jgi:hypothetical protein
MKFRIVSKIAIATMALSLLFAASASDANAGLFGPREAACSFIGEVCYGALLAYARNPSLMCSTTNNILDVIRQAQDEVNALHLRRCDQHHVAKALGRIANAHVQAVARNPSLHDGFGKIVDVCEAALKEALFNGTINLDLEETHDTLCSP